ncbi:MAG: restriction endonuclease [Sulfuritalea sp.]|jgi:hypothetical protein|nr:restriction endonuclease [Sulfuritalea sp.]
MADYDFHQLSPSDFEEMCRDLLEVDFGLKLESFKTGKDDGIDFRYVALGVLVIVQCKHYQRTGLPGLLRDLRKEVAKVRALSPTRYIVVTSVALSPQNKNEIVAIIGADVLQTSDVLGQNDLNAALGRHEKIEQNHYKLWLASRAVLDRVLHNAVATKSDFKVKKVYADLPRYVPSSAFSQALKILQEERVVIISGLPGVGKTTLANLLLYEHLEKGYQAVVIGRDIRDGEERFQERGPQIFYYDDFLGATFLGGHGLAFVKDEDRMLVEFVAMVRSSKSARLILTTREHILNQAIEKSELIRHSDIAAHKVVLEMSNYTSGQRARILYNHLYFSKLPSEYQDELLKGDFYLQIIKHQKFNPRLIEWLSSYHRVQTIEVTRYRQFVSDLLANPAEIWRHAYENQTTDAGRTLLLVLFSLDGQAHIGTLERAFLTLHEERGRRYGFERHADDFRLALRELAGAFITPITAHTIRVLDPSVLDLLNVIVRSAPANAIDLVRGAYRMDQIASLWSFANSRQSESVLAVLRQDADVLAAGIERLLFVPRGVKQSDGSFAFFGMTVEKRLSLLIDIGEKFRHPSFVALIERCLAHFKEARKTDGVNIGDGTMALRSYRWGEWADLESLYPLVIEVRDLILEDASGGCELEDLRELVAVLSTDELAEPNVAAALHEAFEAYRTNRFRSEVHGLQSSAQFERLISDLSEVGQALQVDVSLEEEIARDVSADFEESESAYQDHLQDEWKGRHFEQRADDAAIRELFSSLRQDRK